MAPENLPHILGVGIHDGIPAELYHADPCPEPSLSSSIIKAICQQSPLHAKAQHPRLAGHAFYREESETFDKGTAAHAILLEGRDIVEVLDFNDWRTNAAKEARDKARAEGKIPLLRKVWADVELMVFCTRRQLDEHHARPMVFSAGKPEQTLIWHEDGVWCRARADWLHDDLTAIDDYKSTSKVGGANPELFSRALFSSGHDIQAAWYLRGLRRLRPLTSWNAEPQFRFVVQETAAPYALSVVSLGPGPMDLAEMKILFALKAWRECLATGHWPGYPDRICYATLPTWEEKRWLDREEAEDGV